MYKSRVKCEKVSAMYGKGMNKLRGKSGTKNSSREDKFKQIIPPHSVLSLPAMY